MKLKAKSVRKIDKIIKMAAGVDTIILGYPIKNVDIIELQKLGFTKELPEGESILPFVVGKFTEFNARGKERLRPDLPKEVYHVTYTSTTYDWHRHPHYGIKTRTGLRVAREYISAPSEFLSIAIVNNEKYIITKEINLGDGNSEINIHITNLMLECFGEFEILDKNKTIIKTTKFKKLQWDILPKGIYPWSKISELIRDSTSKLQSDESEIIQERLKTINVYQPDFIGSGIGGFNGYYVFGFTKNNVYVLESVFLDNATYVFHDNWEELSKLTKNEIINSDIPHKRIIHDKKWKRAIGIVISQAKNP
ncbi:TPA: hypothetical protein ACPTCW_000161 [Yersinia enterocolitica]